MRNKEGSATPNRGKTANSNAPTNASPNARTITRLPVYFSCSRPAGIDMMPYATKNENGKNPASPTLSEKLLMMSGMIGPRIFVRKDMTKNTRRIRMTIAGERIDVFTCLSCRTDNGFYSSSKVRYRIENTPYALYVSVPEVAEELLCPMWFKLRKGSGTT